MANCMELVSGVEVEEKQLTWRIQKFSDVVKHDRAIEVQEVFFWAGASIGVPSKWRLSLSLNSRNRRIGINFEMVEKPKKDLLVAECVFKVKRGDGTDFANRKIGIRNGHGHGESGTGWNSGFGEVTDFLDKNAAIPLVEGNLIIHCTFQIIGISAKTQSVEEILEKFHSSSKAKTLSQLTHLVKFPMDPSEIKIVCSDGKQFQARKEVLTVCSPVFDAMFRSDMKEKIEGKVELKDISGKTMAVLHHYFYTGELLPEWRQREVILELINAAAEYQLKELLGFLDGVIGKVCDTGNVLELFTLADKLGLETAEEELLEFIQRKGLTSKEKLRKILKAEVEPEPDTVLQDELRRFFEPDLSDPNQVRSSRRVPRYQFQRPLHPSPHAGVINWLDLIPIPIPPMEEPELPRLAHFFNHLDGI